MAFTVDSARSLAHELHRGQTDKVGNPYVEHLGRVASYVDQSVEHAVMAAWLHDSVEDTTVTTYDLSFVHEVPDPVVVAVTLLTRQRDVSPDAYYARIRDHHLALEVKLADLADNTDPARLGILDEATATRLISKYAKAYSALGVEPIDGQRRRGR